MYTTKQILIKFINLLLAVIVCAFLQNSRPYKGQTKVFDIHNNITTDLQSENKTS